MTWTTEAFDPASRYTIISVDGHAGAELREYKPYLASRWHDEFDAWADAYVNPYADLLAPTAYRNWDSERRLKETESQGVVAEVLFPNTVPPFFAQGNLTALEPTAADYERRWAGLQAHNRWMADFCAAAPGRRAGLAQVFLNDVDDALGEVAWAKREHGRVRRHPLPNVPPNSEIPPLWESRYEPLWDYCEANDVVLNVHSGSGLPDFGEHEAARAIMLIELAWFSHRVVWHLDLRGRARTPPEPEDRAHRTGHVVDPAWHRHPRLVPPAHDARRRGRGRVLRRGRQGHVDDAERVLPTQLLGRCELPAPVGERVALRGRRRPHHVGRRLSALRGFVPVHDRGVARRVRALPGRRDAR